VAVKKTQYTKQELMKLAPGQKFCVGSLVDGDRRCALGWLLSLTGVHDSRMRGLGVFYYEDGHALRYEPLEDILKISCSEYTGIYNQNDRAGFEHRGKAVMYALDDFLPDDFVLSECDEKFRGELKG